MMLYLIKSTLILSLLYCSFAVLLSRETFHRLNRLLLVGTLWASLLLPLAHVPASSPTAGGRLLAESVAQLETGVGFTLVVTPERRMSLTWSDVLLYAWLLGVVVMLAVTVVQVVRLCRLMSGGLRHTDSRGNTVILKPGSVQPFSLLRYIMMSVSDYERHRPYILTHEQEHIRLGHSYDLMLLEVVKTLQWFNPFVWMLEQDMKAIHEYEADMAVIKQGIDAKAYQQLLVVKVMGDRLQPFSNNLGHGSLKKRIFMMYQKQSNRWKMLKALCLIPVSGLALYVFATPEAAAVQSVVENGVQQSAKKDSVYNQVEEKPRYAGGEEALMNDLREIVRYPTEAQELGVQGRIVVSFVICKDGTLDDIKAMGPLTETGWCDQSGEAYVKDCRQEAQKQGKTLTKEEEDQYRAAVKALHKEALRVLNTLPGKWTPGKDKGEAVSVRYTLPIVFRLS